MSTSRLSLLLMLCLILGAAAHAQAPAPLFAPAPRSAAPAPSDEPIEYDWRTGTWTRLRAVRTGRPFSVRVTGLNRLCYNYSFAFNQTPAAAEQLDSFLQLLEPAKSDAKAAGAAATEAKGGDKSALRPSAGMDLLDNVALLARARLKSERGARATRDLSAARAKLDRAEAAARSAAARLVDALSRTERQESAREVAKKALESFYAGACSGAGTRSLVDPGTAWVPAQDVLRSFAEGAPAALDAAETALDSARRETTVARAALLELQSRLAADREGTDIAGAPDIEARLDVLEQQVSALEEDAGALRARITPVRTAAAVLSVALAAIPSTLAVSEQVVTDFAKLDSDEITMIAKATGNKGIASVEDVRTSDSGTIPTYRRNRAFVSAGFMFSTLDEHDFERGNLVGTNDSTYSTFVDRKANARMAFSPTILTNMTLARAGGVDFAATAGLGARSVGDKLSPDFVLGGSALIRDLAVLTVAWHRGRVETLLLGDPKTVRAAAVPDAVNRADAVGEQWGDALALIFSLRAR